jgi:two-component system cell cycle sensor histidine kinase/response regulator CckA
MGITITKQNKKFPPLRILLVEESEHDFLALRRTFEKSRVASKITRYVRAEDALERLTADVTSFDLVVTEHKLPGISGLELCKELIDRKISLPLVLLTGAESESLALEALKAGFNDYLTKDPEQGYPGLLPLFFVHVVRRYRYCERLRRTEEERKTRPPHNTIEENLTEMVCRFLPDTTLTYVNNAYCRFFNTKREELLGQSFMRFVHETDKKKTEENFASLSQENPVEKIQHRVVLSSGEARCLEWTNRAIFGEQGNLTEFQSVGVDISERKEVEEDLLKSEERYRFLVENVFDGFFVCEVKSGDFMLINKRACDLFGYPMQEALTRSIWDIIAPEEHETLKESIKAQLEGKTIGPLRNVFKAVRKDGSEMKTEVSASIVSFQREHVLQGIIRDLTEKEGLRHQFEKADKVEGISALASGIAYQFNDVLSGITENIGRLESDFPEEDNISRYIEPMYDATRRMSLLSGQLLGFSETGKYQPKITSLNEIVEETSTLVQHTIDPAIQVETILTDDTFNVELDIARMQLKLAALMTNTAEAIEGHGRIRIIVKNQEVNDEFAKTHPGLRSGRYVTLALETDGKGLDEKTRRRLIEPFLRPSFEGRDLDMDGMYETEELHEDWIPVDPGPEKGVMVYLFIPVSEPNELAAEEQKTEGPHGKGTVLIVEDEENEEGITKGVLEKLGYYVLEVKTGMEAINLARTFEGEIELAFLDIVLPDMGGEEVYSLLLEARPGLKVIVCSGYANDGIVQKVLDAGAQAFIQKPFTVATLSAKLEELQINL